MGGGECERGIFLLMRAGQVDAVTDERLGHKFEGGAELVGLLLDGALGCGLLSAADDGFSCDDDACFFCRNFTEGITKPLRGVERDRGDHSEIGRHCGGCPYLYTCEVRDEIATRLEREGW